MKKTLQKLTDADVKRLGVQALSNTPGRRSSYGESQLTPEQIKERMDRLPAHVGELLNAFIDAICGDEAGDYVTLRVAGKPMTLTELATAVTDGSLASVLSVKVDGEQGNVAAWLRIILAKLGKTIEDQQTIKEAMANGGLAQGIRVDVGGELTALQTALDALDTRVEENEALTDALNGVLDEILLEQAAVINAIEASEVTSDG